MKTIKPCPFCGTPALISTASVRITRRSRKRVTGRRLKSKRVYYCIGCSDPDCILYNSGKQSSLLFTASIDGFDLMVRRWNRRPDNDRSTY